MKSHHSRRREGSIIFTLSAQRRKLRHGVRQSPKMVHQVEELSMSKRVDSQSSAIKSASFSLLKGTMQAQYCCCLQLNCPFKTKLSEILPKHNSRLLSSKVGTLYHGMLSDIASAVN